MYDEKQTELESLIKKVPCRHNHICCSVGDEQRCSVKDVGLESFVECLEEDPHDFGYALFFGYAYYCQCPVRVYLAKESNT